MRIAVIAYHQNALKLYPKEWIEECVKSIEAQTYMDFEVWELNYGGGKERFFKGKFFSERLPNHIHAMNWLIDRAFEEVDVVANTNIDDFYRPERLEKQLPWIIDGADLVSCNFKYFGERSDLKIVNRGSIATHFARGHNVIAHPAVMMHRRFWDEDLHYSDLVGYEDFDLWKKALAKGKRFHICEEVLLDYRIHSTQITKMYDASGKKKH